MESEESNYLASLLPLTVISDAMKLAKNLQIDGFIQNQSCTGKNHTTQSVLVLFMLFVEMNFKLTYLYKCFQTTTLLYCYLFSLPHKNMPSGVARKLWKVVLAGLPAVTRYRGVIALERASPCGIFTLHQQTQERCASERSKIWEAPLLVLSGWGTSMCENTLEHVLIEICFFQCVFHICLT